MMNADRHNERTNFDNGMEREIGSVKDIGCRPSIAFDVRGRHHRPPGLNTPRERAHKNYFVQVAVGCGREASPAAVESAREAADHNFTQSMVQKPLHAT
jgi:hypothetical protein